MHSRRYAIVVSQLTAVLVANFLCHKHQMKASTYNSLPEKKKCLEHPEIFYMIFEWYRVGRAKLGNYQFYWTWARADLEFLVPFL